MTVEILDMDSDERGKPKVINSPKGPLDQLAFGMKLYAAVYGRQQVPWTYDTLCEAAAEKISDLQNEISDSHSLLVYMANPDNWLDDDDGPLLKRPGGGGQTGIVKVSEGVRPWAFLGPYLKLPQGGGG